VLLRFQAGAAAAEAGDAQGHPQRPHGGACADVACRSPFQDCDSRCMGIIDDRNDWCVGGRLIGVRWEAGPDARRQEVGVTNVWDFRVGSISVA
jgi:hypothetical protein